MAPIQRGQIWIANLNPNRGNEVGKIRPVLIIQGNWLNAVQARTAVVLPLTSQVRPNAEPLRVTIGARGGLKANSQIIVEQPRTLDRTRLGDGPVAELSDAEMAQVEKSLLAVLGMPPSMMPLSNLKFRRGRSISY